jgi:cytoskeleton protein RodZ
LVTRILGQGSSYVVPPQKGLRLTTGNAGGLEILVDGVSVPPLGPFGAVRRDVALDAERLKAGTALAR